MNLGSSLIFFAQTEADAAALGTGILVFYLLLIVFFIACMWKIFTKAGEPGFFAIIPILNGLWLVKIAGLPLWWFVLLLIPLVNILVSIYVTIKLAQAFGKGVGFGVGLILLPFIFYPILAFGSAEHQGS